MGPSLDWLSLEDPSDLIKYRAGDAVFAVSLTPKTMVVNPLQSVASIRFATQLVAKPMDSLV